uniref:Leucine-rich repeat-containing protein 40 n=1 Tax=Meloidogyne hapla TaxID=6305 RepID=A0A1I8BHE9_MELHA
MNVKSSLIPNSTILGLTRKHSHRSSQHNFHKNSQHYHHQQQPLTNRLRHHSKERNSPSSSVVSTSTNSSVVSFDQQPREHRKEHFLPADKFALCFQASKYYKNWGLKERKRLNQLKALIVGKKLDDKIRLGSAHSMADKQVQGQQAKAVTTTIENNTSNGGNPAVELEFRPNNGANSIGDCNLNNGSQSARSKSPGGHIINKISNFARGRYRNSLSEKQTNSVSSDDKVRKDINRELTRCRENGETRLDLNSSELTSIPNSIQSLTQLTELFLYKNKLSSLPPAVGQLINLRILGLSENSLSTLPYTLSSLKKLETLDLRHNKINEEIPSVVFQMESLETLWLRYNKIRTISPNIK